MKYIIVFAIIWLISSTASVIAASPADKNIENALADIIRYENQLKEKTRFKPIRLNGP